MPRTRKVCHICGKNGVLKLSNHLANVHKLSSEERQSYLIRAKRMPVDTATVLTELRKLNRLYDGNCVHFHHVLHTVKTSVWLVGVW